MRSIGTRLIGTRLIGTRLIGTRLIGTVPGLLAVLVAAPLVLSACSGGAGSTATSSVGSGGSAAVPRSAKQDSGSLSAQSGSAGQSGTTKTAALEQTGRSLVVTAGLQVKTDDAAAAAARAEQLVQVAGGYVAAESVGAGTQPMPATASDSSSGASVPSPVTLPDVTGASGTTQALLVLRVPPNQLDSVLSALAGKGSITYQSRSATDVTGQVADVGSRVASAQASITELRTMIDKAASMNDLISLEQALAQRESDLESLQAQQKALADQVQYATITVGYYSQGAPVAPPPVRTGFMRGLTIGWHGFTRTVRAVLVVLGWLVPYAVVVAVLWWPVRRLVRWNRRRGQRVPGPLAPTLAPAGPSAPTSAPEGPDSAAT